MTVITRRPGNPSSSAAVSELGPDLFDQRAQVQRDVPVAGRDPSPVLSSSTLTSFWWATALR